MQYTETTAAYNERRYGKPWMARVITSTTKDFTFIDWEGRPGSVGQFSFTAEPGTILAYGQKDIRKGRGGVDGYQICMPDGTLPPISDSAALELRKMPLPERIPAAARRKIEYNEKLIAEMPPEKMAEPYYADKVKTALDAIETFRRFLPIETQAGDAEDYLSGAV